MVVDYYNFPIALLQGFLVEPQRCLNDILSFSSIAVCGDEKNWKFFRANAESLLGVSFPDVGEAWKRGKAIFFKYYGIGAPIPFTGIKRETYWEYRSTEKSDLEMAILLAYLAYKSIVREQGYFCCSDNYLLARMDGRAKAVKSLDELSPEIQHFGSRWYLAQIRGALKDWHVFIYSARGLHGVFVSFTLPLEKLALIAEGKKHETTARARVEAYNQRMAMARAIAKGQKKPP
jgi:hypothetical protein